MSLRNPESWQILQVLARRVRERHRVAGFAEDAETLDSERPASAGPFGWNIYCTHARSEGHCRLRLLGAVLRDTCQRPLSELPFGDSAWHAELFLVVAMV